VLKNEIDFILELCKYIKPNETIINELINNGLDYPYILGQLLFNRVGGAAYYTLNKINLLGKMNREFRNTLKIIYETNRIKNESFKKALDYLSEIFTDTDIPYALLKGSYLVNIYPTGLRTSNDIDILINFKDSSGISGLLLNNGFVQGNIRNGELVKATRAEIISSQINRGEAVPFIKEINLPYMRFLEIDINFSLDFKPEQDKSIISEMLKKSTCVIKTENGDLYTLSKQDFLIQLCAHLYKEASVYSWVEFGRDQGLYKYLDIYLFISEFSEIIFTDLFEERIKNFGVEKECYYALKETKELFDTENNIALNAFLEKIKPNDISYLKEIYDPATRKKYKYEIPFKEWVFCGKRREYLNEVDS